jgi:hypothetical protein
MAISHQKTDSAPQRYGPGRNFIIQAVKLAWPVIKAGKKLSNFPVLRWLIYPFFMRPYNEVSSIPLNIDVQGPDQFAWTPANAKGVVNVWNGVFLPRWLSSTERL